MPVEMTRRTFLGLLGGAVVAYSDPLNFNSWRDPVGKARVSEILFSAKETGVFTVSRVGGSSTVPLLRAGVSKGANFRWMAMPGEELCFLDGVASCVIEGNIQDWSLVWMDDTGRYFHTDSTGKQERLDA